MLWSQNDRSAKNEYATENENRQEAEGAIDHWRSNPLPIDMVRRVSQGGKFLGELGVIRLFLRGVFFFSTLVALLQSHPLETILASYADERTEDQEFEWSLRPKRLGDFVGQTAVKANLEILIRAAPEQWHVFQPNWPSDTGLGR